MDVIVNSGDEQTVREKWGLEEPENSDTDIADFERIVEKREAICQAYNELCPVKIPYFLWGQVKGDS